MTRLKEAALREKVKHLKLGLYLLKEVDFKRMLIVGCDPCHPVLFGVGVNRSSYGEGTSEASSVCSFHGFLPP